MQPVSVAIINREDIEVVFDDGVSAIFEPYRHGSGYQIEGLRNFTLKNKSGIICKVNSRLYRSGPMNSENKIVEIHSITQEKVAEYWQQSKDFVTNKFYPKGREGENYKIHDDSYWYHWRVVTEGWISLNLLKEGMMKKIKR